MLKSLHCFAVCASNLRNELLMMKISLNVTNVFMFRIIQLLKKNLLKNIMMIYCQNILKLKKF